MQDVIKTGVIGHPIAHSKSPMIHMHWMKQYDINGTYTAIDCTPDGLPECINRLHDDGYAGLNITIPHKQAIMKLCDIIDDTAQAIGAVNTIVFENGLIRGTNTDAFGFFENMRQTIPDIDLHGKTALVIGAGGAAKAVLHALIQNGADHILLTNRTRETAEHLTNTFQNTRVIAWDDKNPSVKTADIIINTTSLGMTGYPDLKLDFTHAKPDAIVYDIVYNPLMTVFLTEAQTAGLNIVTGIGMLVHQARPAFQVWHGLLPDVSDFLIKEIKEVLL